MNKLLNVYKPRGKTPLDMIKIVKQTYPEYADQSISYAGRLDPLAHGVLLLTLGEAIKEKERYLELAKSYTFEVLFGVATDSYDTLGLVKDKLYIKPASNVNFIVKSFVKSHLGKHKQTYPPFSSKTVQGKPLFVWAKEGMLSEIVIPQREIEIFDFDLLGFSEIKSDDLQKRIFSSNALVHGDFRQDAIRQTWETYFQTNTTTFLTATFQINCSSGTYIRGLANELGETLGCGALALDILRTKVGEYKLSESLKL